jgi:hypothetical protein
MLYNFIFKNKRIDKKIIFGSDRKNKNTEES